MLRDTGREKLIGNLEETYGFVVRRHMVLVNLNNTSRWIDFNLLGVGPRAREFEHQHKHKVDRPADDVSMKNYEAPNAKLRVAMRIHFDRNHCTHFVFHSASHLQASFFNFMSLQ